MAKTLILIRHAHRDNSRRELDNGLSDKGREQARNVKRFFLSRFRAEEFSSGLWMVSSPKLRCVQTLEPVSKEIDRPVDIHPGLVEQGSKESRAGLEDRIHAFVHEWTQTKIPLTVLCSHGDWLPVAVFHLLGLQLELKKGSWFEIEWEGGRGVLKWYVANFKHFYG